MDNQSQLFEMIRDRFDGLDSQLAKLNDTLSEHVKLDAEYWKKIDAGEAQLKLLKYVAGIGGGSGIVSAIYHWFRH